MKKVHLETDRLILREWIDEARKPFAQMNADPMVMEYMPRRLDEGASDKLVDRFSQHFKKHGYGLYVAESKDTKEFMGFVGLSNVELEVPFAPAVEIAWRLSYEFWGQGYASEAAKSVLKHGLGKLKIPEIVAFTVYDNTRSIAVIEKLGLERDPKGDFDYPRLPKGHPLAKHVLFRIAA